MNAERLCMGLLCALVMTAGCARRIPLPEHLRLEDAAALRARMLEARPQVESYSAEARITYFGKAGRARGSAIVAVRRPASLRYELHGPHGGVLEAFATNGHELQLLDMRNNRFVYGPATPDNIDRLLPFAPLHLDAAAWVGLFFGEVLPPPEAELRYDERTGYFVVRWSTEGVTRQLEVEPATHRSVRAQVLADGVLVSEVAVHERDAKGLPERLTMKVPGAQADLDVRLRDVEHDPELDPSAFVIDPPAGVLPERL